MNKSGKTLTIFLVVFSILLLSLTAISIFFFQKEREMRQGAQAKLEVSEQDRARISGELEESIAKNTLFEQRLKEADEKINGLLDDFDLEKALKEEIKKENLVLKNNVDSLTVEKNKFQKEAIALREKTASLDQELTASKNLGIELTEKLREREERIKSLEEATEQDKVDLDKIVITPGEPVESIETQEGVSEKSPEAVEGKILKINRENNFVIINLGQESKMQEDAVVKIYRGKSLLGEAKVTRVQALMSVADVLPPLLAKKIKVNDKVVVPQ
ncbi:MAG: hypothetical protein PHY73_03815 [Candidatus Omnitrophica bacterium]|nr:hypothetical protein [Candidatus Omnitrophota bacterium]